MPGTGLSASCKLLPDLIFTKPLWSKDDAHFTDEKLSFWEDTIVWDSFSLFMAFLSSSFI